MLFFHGGDAVARERNLAAHRVPIGEPFVPLASSIALAGVSLGSRAVSLEDGVARLLLRNVQAPLQLRQRVARRAAHQPPLEVQPREPALAVQSGHHPPRRGRRAQMRRRERVDARERALDVLHEPRAGRRGRLAHGGGRGGHRGRHDERRAPMRRECPMRECYLSSREQERVSASTGVELFLFLYGLLV